MSRLTKAIAMAAQAHEHQLRKGTTVPYISHPMAVAALVLDMGGDDDTMCAALLHDTVEDGGGPPMLDRINKEFGSNVAYMVADVTEPGGLPKPPWKERKEGYLKQIETALPGSLLIILADKLHNSSCTLRDKTPDRWRRFNADYKSQRWWYRSVADELNKRWKELPETALPYLDELTSVLTELFQTGGIDS